MLGAVAGWKLDIRLLGVMLYQLEGHQPTILDADATFIADNATVIGRVTLHSNTSIWFNAVLRGDQEAITIGSGSNVQDGTVMHTDPGYPLTVGSDVTIGHQAMLHGCTIGDGALLGIKSVILNGARIGRNCLIGAGALVPEGQEIPDNSLVMGIPGRIKRQISQKEIEKIQTGTSHYVANLRRYLNNFSAV